MLTWPKNHKSPALALTLSHSVNVGWHFTCLYFCFIYLRKGGAEFPEVQMKLWP